MNRRGFTMIELGVTLAVVAILAAIAVATLEGTRRNTSLETTAFDVLSQVQGLRFTALAEQRDYLLVVASPPGNDSSQCGILDASSCVRTFVLRAPQAGWNVAAFDPAAPGVLADFVDSTTLPRGTVLDLAGVGAQAPVPFDGVRTFAPDVTANCAGARTCVAVRFAASGEVAPEFVAVPGVTRSGLAFGLTTDLLGMSKSAQRRAVMVSFPSGIAKSFTY